MKHSLSRGDRKRSRHHILDYSLLSLKYFSIRPRRVRGAFGNLCSKRFYKFGCFEKSLVLAEYQSGNHAAISECGVGNWFRLLYGMRDGVDVARRSQTLLN